MEEKAPTASPTVEPPRPPPPPPPAPETPPATVPRTPTDFAAAVEKARAIGADHRRTFYCGCIYTTDDKVARGTCGYETRAEEALARRVVWERVVPLRAFGSHRPCWTSTSCTNAEGTPLTGVSCCMENDPQFRAMATDLFNVVPIIGEVAQDRSNYDFGEIEGEQRLYGACDFEVDRHRAVAEPAESIRGDIARIYLYMHEVYGDGLPLSPSDLERFRAWHEADPPDEWERRRADRIATEQRVASFWSSR